MYYSNFNDVGNLCKDAEVFPVGDKKKVTLRMAFDAGKDKTVFYDVICWDKMAEILSNMKKGEPLLVQGLLSEDTWTDKATGEERSKPIIKLNGFKFVRGGNRQEGSETDVSTPTKKSKAKDSGNTPDMPF